MLKQKLSQKLLQKLSPQQIQLMRLLQVPTAQLEQRIKEELELNPALEEGKEKEEENTEESEDIIDEKEETEQDILDDDVDLIEYMSDDEIADYKLSNYKYSNDDEQYTIQSPIINTFQEYLIEQLGLLNLNESQEVLAKHIIGNVDEDGYLRRSLISIVDDLAFSQNITTTEKELLTILKNIQTFDPPGVGARDLQECIFIQLSRNIKNDKTNKLAKKIIKDHFEAFIKKLYDKLQVALKVSKDNLKTTIDEILKLNPKPGSAYIDNSKSQEYIIPDFIITNDNGELILSLNNRNAPELRISRNYRDMIKDFGKTKKKDKKQTETIQFIKQKLDSAKWFIDAIKQRQETLLNTMHAIIEYQHDYFMTGDETKLHPMKLKNIGKKTGLDLSTISRVSNSKYVQTEFGTFPLKHFFAEGFITEEGEEISTRKIKQILLNFIDKEDKNKPLTDQQLKDLLKEKGYNMARRTIAKYREQLNIPVARLRKEL